MSSVRALARWRRDGGVAESFAQEIQASNFRQLVGYLVGQRPFIVKTVVRTPQVADTEQEAGARAAKEAPGAFPVKRAG